MNKVINLKFDKILEIKIIKSKIYMKPFKSNYYYYPHVFWWKYELKIIRKLKVSQKVFFFRISIYLKVKGKNVRNIIKKKCQDNILQ
jgi:hypothetical protein